MRGPGREDFIDGPLWVLRQCWGEVPKLTLVDGPWWWRLEGVAGDGVVVPWEIDPWVSSDDQCGGPQGAGGCLGSIGIGLLALGLRGNEHWLGARRELEGGACGVLAGRIS